MRVTFGPYVSRRPKLLTRNSQGGRASAVDVKFRFDIEQQIGWIKSPVSIPLLTLLLRIYGNGPIFKGSEAGTQDLDSHMEDSVWLYYRDNQPRRLILIQLVYGYTLTTDTNLTYGKIV
jgi:hypothetical protein